jgi:hypothetical protein
VKAALTNKNVNGKRPLSVTIAGWLFIIMGAVGFVYHFPELTLSDPFENDAILVLVVRLLAIVGGAMILRKVSAGRWLLIIWMGYHVALSIYHDVSELIMHAIFLIALLVIFFHPKVRTYFKGTILNARSNHGI